MFPSTACIYIGSTTFTMLLTILHDILCNIYTSGNMYVATRCDLCGQNLAVGTFDSQFSHDTNPDEAVNLYIVLTACNHIAHPSEMYGGRRPE